MMINANLTALGCALRDSRIGQRSCPSAAKVVATKSDFKKPL